MSIEEIRALLNDIESDRVERTISTTNTDKFGQAICAFANDLPDHKQAGFLFLGVKDDGEVQGLDVTDELLKNVLVGDLPLYASERDKTPFAQHAFIMDFYKPID